MDVSVIIPTFNRQAFLRAAISSVRAQTLAPAEIVVVDDGSTDGTDQAISSLGSDIVYVRQQNAGPAAARNAGLEVARSTLVAFLDTDDRWMPQKLERQIPILRAAPEVALVSADTAIVDERGEAMVDSNFSVRGLKEFFEGLKGGPVPDAPSRLLTTNFINTSTVVARRDVLRACGGFDPRLRFGEDLELWLRVGARHAISCLPDVLEVRCEHARNVTKSVESMLRNYVTLAEILRSWASDRMPGWGFDPDRYVADAWTELGYWYFSQRRMTDARRALAASLRERFSRRAAAYGFAACMPPRLVDSARAAKQRLWGTGLA